jgi:lysophospholipase L1-like esterase
MSSHPRSRAKTLLFVFALAALGTAGLLIAAEIVVRIKFAIDNKDAGYLVIGIVPNSRRITARRQPVALPVIPAGTVRTDGPAPATANAGPRMGGAPGTMLAPGTVTTIWNDCAQKSIEYRANAAGGRGPDWADTKRPGSVRILAFGESVTWGAGAPEDRAWPSLLETKLKADHGVDAEVLNWGQPGSRLKSMTEHLPPVLDKYRPDVIVHYAGFNQTWQAAEVPGVLKFLNYRSMLYTYIYEKMYFRAEASAARLLPDTHTYAKDFEKLLTVARTRGASVVVVAEATAAGPPSPERAACAARWADAPALQACLNDLMTRVDSRYSRVQWARMYKTDVMQRVLTDVAEREHAPVIDPRGLLVERAPAPRLFCDEAHLTDAGNVALAGAIAGPLAGHLKARLQRHSGS